MNLQERGEFVDLVAQAVVDKIEERERVNGMVSMVVARVVALQQEEAALKAETTDAKETENAWCERDAPIAASRSDRFAD